MNKNLSIKKSVIALSLLMLLLVAFVPSALAFDGREGNRIVIAANEIVNDDLYLTATTIVVDGTVKGDLFAAGQTVQVNGTVDGSLFAAGQDVIVNGEVKGSVWAAAQSVILNGKSANSTRIAGYSLTIGEKAVINRDLLGGAYSLEMKKGSQVGQDMLYGGYQAIVAGDVSRNLCVGASALEISGHIGGNVKAEVDANGDGKAPSPRTYSPNLPIVPVVPPGLTVSKEAKIDGNLDYTSRERALLAEGTVAGSTKQIIPEVGKNVKVDVTPQSAFVTWLLSNLRRLIALVIVALLLAWLAPLWILRPASRLQEKPWPSLGWGALTAFLFPVAALLVIIVVIMVAVLLGALTLGNLSGSVLGLGFSAVAGCVVIFGLVVSYLTKIVVSYLAGRWILNRFNPSLSEKPYWPVLVGLPILVILMAVPILGWLVDLAVTLFGLGALFLLWHERNMPPAAAVEIAPLAA